MPEQGLEEFAEQRGLIEDLRRTNYRLQAQLAAAKQRNDEMIAATITAARDAILSLSSESIVIPQVRSGPGTPEGAIWHLTDWQGGKVSTTYNSTIMRERIGKFCRKANWITEIQRAAHGVNECMILFGGDMVEGLFNFPRQPFEVDASIHTQWTQVSQLVIDTVETALSIYPKVSVVAEWGNHGRIGSKRDAIPRSDNIDRMVYHLARSVLNTKYDPDRLWWEDSPEDIQRVEFGNYRALLVHGDEAGRNGYVSAQTMIQHVNRWKAGAYPWDFRDCYIGHYHRHAEEPLANGEGAIYWTGSTESDNRYAMEQLAAAAVPSQRLHFIDMEEGRVAAQYKIWVK